MGEAPAIVFVIDDDPSMRAALEDLVSSVGLKVRLFASPQEFLESERPDAAGCLLLDVRLPGMSGLTFQKELAKVGVALPVIFITGHGDIPMSVLEIQEDEIKLQIVRWNNLSGTASGCRTTLSHASRPNDLWCADYKGEFMLADRRHHHADTSFKERGWT